MLSTVAVSESRVPHGRGFLSLVGRARSSAPAPFWCDVFFGEFASSGAPLKFSDVATTDINAPSNVDCCNPAPAAPAPAGRSADR